MSFEELSKEQQIMVTMRKVLTSIVKELAPAPGETYPLTKRTVEDIRMCLSLIAMREKELFDEQGIENKMRPHYIDEPQQSKVVPIDSLKRTKPK